MILFLFQGTVCRSFALVEIILHGKSEASLPKLCVSVYCDSLNLKLSENLYFMMLH